jgi:ABC-type Zn uptake system ZnuABC Zn-binding protein ZnuA
MLLISACGEGALSVGGDEAEIATLRIEDLRPIERQAGEPIYILTTTSFVHEVVSAVSGDEVRVERLLPLGVDPHAFEPNPGDLRALADADLVVINGLGLEEFLEEMLRNAGGAERVISLSQGIDPLTFGATSRKDGEHAEAVSPDPHVWLDPVRMTRWTQNAVEALAAIDPDHAQRYIARGEAHVQMLQELHAWILSEVDSIPLSGRILVTDHEALRYFADRYRFEIVGAIIPAYSTAAEPSAQELARLERRVRSAGARAVFVGAGINPDTAAQLAADTGLQLVPLYLGSLTGPEGPAGTYEELMQYNVRAIVEAILTEG